MLTPEIAQALGPLARILAADPQTTVHITGYADKTGASARNMRLALDRAKAVRAALIAHGARPEQTVLKAPAAVTGGDDDREARRVEVTQVAARAAPKATPR